MEDERKTRILVVEDDPGQASVISLRLKRAFDALVDAAESCAAAREKSASGAYDLITLDYQLPDGDGLMLLEEIMGMEDPPPVVVITGHGDEQTAVSAFKMGAYGYVVKDKRMASMVVKEARNAMARARLARAEAALAESENKLRNMFEATRTGILVFDADGRLEEANQAAVDLLGIPAVQDARIVEQVIPPYLSADVKERTARGGTVTVVTDYDFDRVRQSGFYEPVRKGRAILEGTITPLLAPGRDAAQGYLCQVADVTDRVRSERALKAQRDLAMGVLASPTLDEALEKVLSTVIDASGLDSGGIYLRDPDTGALDLACHKGLKDEFAQAVLHYEPGSSRAHLVEAGRAVYAGFEELPPGDRKLNAEGLKAFAMVPLRAGEEVLGCVNLSSHTLDEIPGELKTIIEALVVPAAEAIQRQTVLSALAEERDRIASILDALPIGVALFGPDGRMIQQNRAAAELVALSPDQRDERTAYSSEREITDWDGNPVPPGEIPFTRAARTREPVMGMRIAARNGRGERAYISQSATPLFDENGDLASVLVCAEDMTGFRDAQLALQRGERLYRETVESLNEGLWVLDTGDATTFVNDRMAEMLGFTPEEMIGKSVYDFVDEAGRTVMEHNLRLRRRGIAQQYDFDFIRRDGTKVSTYLAAMPWMDEKGDYLGTHAGVLDITDRKRMEEALRESVMLYKKQFETSPDAVVVTDLDGTIKLASRRAAEMYGFDSAGDLEGRNSLDFIAPEQREWASQSRDRTRREGFVRGLEYEMLRKDGGRFVGGRSSALLQDANGQPAGFIETTRDISRQKRTERDLSVLNAELEGYAHIVSHDLKGPISALIAATDMLILAIGKVDDRETREALEESAQLISGSGNRAYDLINSLLLLAESGQKPGKLESVSIDATVDLVLTEKAAEIAERGVRVERSDDLGRIVADPTHVYQLIANLVGNCIKHNEAEEPVLRIHRRESPPGTLRLVVSDNGGGIPEGLLDRLFEPFFKSDRGGVGLGLSIANRVAGVYSGSIVACNDDGACFEVTLRDYPRG